jgi:hypothetical protein
MEETKWTVPVLVAVIGAIGVVVAAVIPYLLPPHGSPSRPPQSAYQGTATLTGDNYREIDLDGDHIADLVHGTSALTTSKNSLIALLDRGQQPSPEICQTVLTTNGSHRIAVPQLESGLSLCIRTSAGRLGTVTLDLVRDYPPKPKPPRTGPPEPEQLLGEVEISYRIW